MPFTALYKRHIEVRGRLFELPPWEAEVCTMAVNEVGQSATKGRCLISTSLVQSVVAFAVQTEETLLCDHQHDLGIFQRPVPASRFKNITFKFKTVPSSSYGWGSIPGRGK